MVKKLTLLMIMGKHLKGHLLYGPLLGIMILAFGD